MHVVGSLCRLLGLAALALSGCAKSPSVIDVQITADGTVPAVLLLQSTVVRESAPSTPSILKWVSPTGGDPDAGRPGGFPFPLLLHVSVHPSWSGPVSVTVEGLDYDDPRKIIATGTTQATVVPEQTTTAALSLTGVSMGSGGDGGGGDSGADAGVAGDGASPDAAD
jgi:hypothetical protein